MFVFRSNININFIELKYRFFYLIYSAIFIFCICFFYKIELFYLISNLFLEFKDGFIYTGLFDPLLVYLKLSLLFTCILTYPMFLYLLGMFFFRAFSTFLLGYWFYYCFLFYSLAIILFICMTKFLLPNIFDFLISFQRQGGEGNILELALQATITQYYNFFFYYLFTYLIFILIPNVFLILVLLEVVDRNIFLNSIYRKYLYLTSFLIFVMVAPPDFLIQVSILPFLLIFIELFIFFTTYFYIIYFYYLRREGFEPTMK